MTFLHYQPDQRGGIDNDRLFKKFGPCGEI